MTRHRQLSADFGKRLRQARTEAGMSAEDLAQRVGFKARASISALERSEQSASIELAEKLAEALGVRAVWLAYGEDPQREE